MRKIFTIAAREYRAMVGTKAFIFSMLMMPLLMFGGIFAMEILSQTGEIKDQEIIVIDQTGKLFTELSFAANQYNRSVDKQAAEQGQEEQAGKESKLGSIKKKSKTDGLGNFSRGQRFRLTLWDQPNVTEEDRFALSEKIRNQEIYAFVEIPEKIFNVDLEELIRDPKSLPVVSFYSEDSNFSDARQWLSVVISELVKANRLQADGVDFERIKKLSIPTPVKGLSLLEMDSSGQIQPGREKDDLTAILLPMGVMMMMFMVIFMAAQPMLESVLEEKSQRIAEVLLGSANPFQLMSGKLLGTVGGSLTILVVYLAGGYFLASSRGWTDKLPVDLVPWFIVFQILGVLFFASIFMAVGASVSQLKEAQSLLLPVWMLLMSPMFIWFMVIRDPNGSLATGFSFFPPATPTMMMLRMSTSATIPLWQPILGLVILLVSTLIGIYVASRIFRVGLLWQGKAPKINELLRWAFRG
ncbi:MAG: ABC transporter permease [Pirellulaceae bacterium]|nr:ABC transporter permease [Pirellulaceae bacterium]